MRKNASILGSYTTEPPLGAICFVHRLPKVTRVQRVPVAVTKETLRTLRSFTPLQTHMESKTGVRFSKGVPCECGAAAGLASGKPPNNLGTISSLLRL